MSPHAPFRAATRRPGLAILIAITAVGPLALNIFIPSMPGLQKVFDADYGTIQLSLSLYLIGIAVAQLFYGPLSDRFGRRPALLGGMTLFLLGSLACLLAPSIGMLIAGRVLQAVGACAGMVLARAIIRDLYDRAEAASRLGYVMMAMVVAPMLAPSIGGLLDVWFGWRASFAFVALCGIAVLGAALVALHETNPARQAGGHSASFLMGFLRLLRMPAFNGYAWQGAFTSGVFFSFLGGAPYVMVELLGRTPAEYGLWFISLSAMYMFGNFLAGRFSARVGSDRMIWYGVALGLVGTSVLTLSVLAGAVSPVFLFGGMSIVSVGNGLSLPNGMAGAISVAPKMAGAASGLAGFLQMGVGAGLSYLAGMLLHDSALPLALVMLAAALAAIAAHALGRSWSVRQETGGQV